MYYITLECAEVFKGAIYSKLRTLSRVGRSAHRLGYKTESDIMQSDLWLELLTLSGKDVKDPLEKEKV